MVPEVWTPSKEYKIGGRKKCLVLYVGVKEATETVFVVSFLLSLNLFLSLLSSGKCHQMQHNIKLMIREAYTLDKNISYETLVRLD